MTQRLPPEGVGCLLIPNTDKGAPAAFYPFYSAFQDGVPGEQGNNGCMWGFGNDLPGATTDFWRAYRRVGAREPRAGLITESYVKPE